MSITKSLTMAILTTVVSFSAVADSGHHDDEKAVKVAAETPMAGGQMPMMQGGQGGMPMLQGQQGGMPMMQMMQMMQEQHAMMQAHMTKMETHMANIEGLLRELVELQKK